jgi:hypothetical protein
MERDGPRSQSGPRRFFLRAAERGGRPPRPRRHRAGPGNRWSRSSWCPLPVSPLGQRAAPGIHCPAGSARATGGRLSCRRHASASYARSQGLFWGSASPSTAPAPRFMASCSGPCHQPQGNDGAYSSILPSHVRPVSNPGREVQGTPDLTRATEAVGRDDMGGAVAHRISMGPRCRRIAVRRGGRPPPGGCCRPRCRRAARWRPGADDHRTVATPASAATPSWPCCPHHSVGRHSSGQNDDGARRLR